MKYILSLIYSIAFVIAGLFILYKRYQNNEEKTTLNKIVNENKVYCICSVMLLLFTGVVFFLMADKDRGVLLEVIIKWLTIIYGCFIIAFIDYKEHIIPNKIILGLLILRIFFMIYEVVNQKEFLNYLVLYPLLGALVGGMLMVIGMFISKKGIGMGDVKLFFIIGFYVNSYYIMPTLIYTFLICAIVGIILLISRKATMHDVLPLAPFAFCGVLAQFSLIMIGG